MSLSAINAIHGYVQPFKSHYKNIQELFILFNLITLFTFSLYHGPNTAIVNASVGIAFIHFAIILLHHVWLFQCKSVIKSIFTSNNFIAKTSNNIKEFIVNRWRTTMSQPGRLQNIPLRDTVPDVTYQYDRFREPLIGLDS